MIGVSGVVAGIFKNVCFGLFNVPYIFAFIVENNDSCVIGICNVNIFLGNVSVNTVRNKTFPDKYALRSLESIVRYTVAVTEG